MATVGTLMSFDARDIDLSAWKDERVSRRAALEVTTATLLTGTRFWHGGSLAR